MTKLQQTAIDRLAEFDAAQDPNCPACRNLSMIGVKCNRHRVMADSTVLVLKAQAKGYTGSDWREAERFLGASHVTVR